MDSILTLVLAGILAFAVVMYVLLDGFDLGVGILFPFTKSEQDRDIMMSSLTPVWDGNETWLVLGGATLYGAFPIVYSTILPTLYLPLFIMLISLVFRGVSFEFRHMAHHDKWIWNACFALGSLIAAFCQGMVLGTFVQGYTDNAGVITLQHYHWATPFAFMTGIAVVIGYTLLGACWLIKKTEGELQQQMYRSAKYALVLVAIFMIIAGLWTPFVDPHIYTRWFTMPGLAIVAPLGALEIITVLALWRVLSTKSSEHKPFILTMFAFLWAYISFIVSVWPYAIPHAITVWQAAAPANVQKFILFGLVVVVPIILIYTLYSYKVFKGKVTHDTGVHY
jgi:cytochrome d ubiquinol oxidase subunit II